MAPLQTHGDVVTLLLNECNEGQIVSEREQYLLQIDKLVNSHVLHGSESLCKLLRYLAKHALDHPGSPIKEYQIATEVFARSEDFDPQLDSMVRVQAGRLRAKLSEYYNTDGAEDAAGVELPKGTYILSLHHRVSALRSHSGSPEDNKCESARRGHPYRMWGVATASLAILFLPSAGGAFALAPHPRPPQGAGPV